MCESDRVGACAGYPCADRLPLVPGGNAAGPGAEGRTPHPGVSGNRHRSGPEDRRRWPVRASVLARPEAGPGGAGSTAVHLGGGSRTAGGAGGGRGRVWDERVTGEGAQAAVGPGGDRRGGRAPRPARADEHRAGRGCLVRAQSPPSGTRRLRSDRRPGARHGGGADLVLRQALRTPVGAEPGVEGSRLRPAGHRTQGREAADLRRRRVSALREVAGPFVVAPPAGARVRTRLRVPGIDAAALREVGEYLGSLASADLAARCAEGSLDAKHRARSRQVRKQELTAKSSSRWAGALTRTSEDAYQLAHRNLLAEREQQLGTGRLSVCRGGKALLHKRNHLADAGLTETRWRERWAAARLFITADGEKDKTWGNETIRWNPDQKWLEIRLPAPLSGLANRPSGRYRLSCPVEFTYRGGDVAAQAATGAVRYDICLDPARGRWYLDASWKTPAIEPITLAQARQGTVVAVDVNAGHLAVAVLDPDGNQAGAPYTIGLPLAGMPSSTRDGRLRAAITSILTTAREHRASAVVIENLDFGDARHQGRERTDNRPSRGRRGRAFRHQVAGIPTARFRDRLTHMTCNTGMTVIAVDPAYTSRWGAQHWLAPMQQHHPKLTGHHAAAFVIGRRGLGLRARRRASGNLPAPEDAAAPERAKSTQARSETHPKTGTETRGPATRTDPRQPPGIRPEGPDGPRQATRRPKTVRGRPPGRTRSC